MKVNIELSSFSDVKQKKENYVFENYDEDFFPPKHGLTFSKMFEYWSEIFKKKGIDYKPDYFDMSKKEFRFIFEIKRIN